MIEIVSYSVTLDRPCFGCTNLMDVIFTEWSFRECYVIDLVHYNVQWCAGSLHIDVISQESNSLGTLKDGIAKVTIRKTGKERGKQLTMQRYSNTLSSPAIVLTTGSIVIHSKSTKYMIFTKHYK